MMNHDFLGYCVTTIGLAVTCLFHCTHVRGDDTIFQDIESTEVTESSGLAPSNREPGIFWTHNDSGGEAKLFAIDSKGKLTGSVVLEGAEAVDWEDMSSYVDGSDPRLMVGDFGDNGAKRESVSIYLFDEPNPYEHSRVSSLQRIDYRYPDGPHDCEALGVAPLRREILLVTKSILPVAACYSIRLPKRDEGPRFRQQPSRIGTLAIPLVASMDIESGTGDIILCNYFQCFRYLRASDDSSAQWMKQIPEMTNLPKLKQIEAITFDTNGDVWVTSEGIPGKIAKVSMPLTQRAGSSD